MVNPTSTPKTVAELEDVAMDLWEQIQSIQLQLRDPGRVGETAKERPDFLAWRQKAKTALDMKVRLYRKTMRQIKALRGGSVDTQYRQPEILNVVRATAGLLDALDRRKADTEAAHQSRIRDATQRTEAAFAALRKTGFPVDEGAGL